MKNRIAAVTLLTIMLSSGFIGINLMHSGATSAIFPLPRSSAPASNYYYFSEGGSLSYTLAALQGLVDRNQPQLFAITNQQDSSWMAYMNSVYGLSGTKLTQTQVLTMFKSVATTNGKVNLIVFGGSASGTSPQFNEELNIADTLAGVYNALPVQQSALSTVESAVGSYNILYDLPTLCSSGSIDCNNTQDDMVKAYTWLWNLVKGSVSTEMFSMNPTGLAAVTDYTVENRAFTFEFCCGVTSQQETMDSNVMTFTNMVLGSLPSGIPDIGYIGLGSEVFSITTFSQHGDYELSSSGAPDLSFYSGLPVLTGLSQASSVMTSVAYNGAKTYVLWEFTQGDALIYEAYNNWKQWNAIDPSTNKPYRNEIPATWQVAPIMAVVYQPILKDWYATQVGSLDDFITAPSGGGGYDHPSEMPNEAAWGQVDNTVSTNAGMSTQFLIFHDNPYSGSTLSTYISDAHPKAVLLWQNNGHAPEMVNGVPVMTSTFWEKAGATYTSTDVSSAVSQIQNAHTHFVYVIMSAQNPGFPFIKQVMSQLGSNYQAVNAQQFTSLYCQSVGTTCV